MKQISILVLVSVFFAACSNSHKANPKLNIQGTWKIISAQNITGIDTTFTGYTIGMDGIKIIGKTHFSFFQHDLNKGHDSTARFSSGTGKYTLSDNQYTEFLEFCSGREWEGNTFEFVLAVKNDSLFQTGIEKIESIGLDRRITETYIRIK